MKEETYTFEPPQREGIIFHVVVLLLLVVAAISLFSQATQAALGPFFLYYLLGSTFLALPLPFLIYRLLSLRRGAYILERDGIRLQWGLRVEDIPITEVLWVRLVEDLERPLALPWLRLPGSIVGTRRHLGQVVEFMASETRALVLIGTPQRIYAISPGDRNAFLRAFQLQTELGSLMPLRPQSVYPTFLLVEVWESRLARVLLVLGILLGLVLLIWVGSAVPSRATVALGFAPDGTPLEPVPAVQLFLLPVINIFFFLGNFILGLFFYRGSRSQPLPYLLWGSSVVTAALFLTAVYYML